MNAAQLAGFFSAHAVWSVSDGGTLIPIYASVDEGEKPEMKRLANERAEEAVAFGRALLESETAKNRLLIFDGRIPVGNEKVDALIVEWRSDSSPGQQVTLAIPYTPGTEHQRFLVHRPKVLGSQLEPGEVLESVLNAFWHGVDQHTEGVKVWNEHLDQSK